MRGKIVKGGRPAGYYFAADRSPRAGSATGFTQNEKGTHRHSRWFFICGPCPRILATRHVALHVLASAYCPYRQPASGLHLPEHGQLVAVLVLLQLILDIRRNLCRIFASRVDIVAAAPKLPTLVLNLQGGKLFVQHQAALPL